MEPLPDPRNPLVLAQASSADMGEIPHVILPSPNPFDQAEVSSTNWGQIPHASPFHNPFDEAGASSTNLCEILPALPYPNPFHQAEASFTDLDMIPHGLPFSNPYDQAEAASSTGALSLTSWEIALDGGLDQLEESCPFIPLCLILEATNNFDDALVIGTGGFGKVYKAIIDEGATTTAVAVKRLNAESKQGAQEFWTEVKLLSKFRHTNIVSLIGYCNENQEMILVYEYIAGGTLANHLYGTSKEESGGSRSHLTWEQRLNIFLHAALGLDHLHNVSEQGIIHRDVKSTNILLDENWVAKVSDFGISKHIQSWTTTHVTTHVKGTFGYLDPDYFYTKRLTQKSDVYAFGVVLLEVLCGRPPIDRKLEEEQISLTNWAQKYLKKGKIDRIIDPSLNGETTPRSLKYITELAIKCLQNQPKGRPTMAEAVEGLDLAILAFHEHKLILLGTITTAFHGIKILPKGRDHLSRAGKGNSSTNREGPISYLCDCLRQWAYPKFSLSEISAATNDFNDALLMHKDRFFHLYKGFRVRGTRLVTIKRYNVRKAHLAEAARTEIRVQLLTHHPNIVSLLGFCEAKHEFILVYEGTVNGTLRNHLHKNNKDPLLWKKRLEICIDIARGLKYLHTNTEQKFIHRDVNPSNIIVDDNWVAKVAAFEESVPIPTSMETEGLETALCGTEYVTTKSDTYSFGVVLMDVLCANKTLCVPNSDEVWSLQWFWSCIEGGTIDEFIDPYLLGQIAPGCFRHYVNLALSCVADEVERPSMDGVLLGLESSLQMQEAWENSIKRGDEVRSADVPRSYNDIISVESKFTIEYSSSAQESPWTSGIISLPVLAPRRTPPNRTTKDRMSRRSFSKKRKIPISAKVYTMAELQSATNGLSEENFLGEGSLGSVYKEELPNGQNIKTVALAHNEEEQFLDVIWNAARLRHPNIVTLLGYCLERGHHLLVYEYVRNLTLDDALHSDAYMTLSWGQRLRIALGIARALDYLHSTCLPPVAHSNLKAANILLDEELMPRLSDCGLAVLRPLTSNSIKLKASEMAIANTGYVAPERIQNGFDSVEGDVYAFGVLLLELLTGKRPFDSFRPREDKTLVKWASSRLHDNESLENMVDPSIHKLLSSRALSRFADIVSLCVQAEKEFRPPMSEIVESLSSLINKAGI